MRNISCSTYLNFLYITCYDLSRKFELLFGMNQKLFTTVLYINKIKFCFYNELLSLIKMNLMPGRMYYACPHNSESGGWNISSIWRIGGCSTYTDRYHAGTHWIPKKVKNDNPLTDSSGQKQTLHPCM